MSAAFRSVLPSAALLLFATGSAVFAQEQAKGKFPEGWKALFAESAGRAEDVFFVSMAPGWHVTTGPAVTLYHPDSSAAGNYRIESEIFLFPPGEYLEPWGISFGRRDTGARASHSAFLLRRDGRFRIERTRAGQTVVLKDWTQHAAIRPHEAVEGNVRNVLAIEAGPTEVRFLVNDQEIARLPHADLETDGSFGLQLGRNVNLHVTRLARR
jgi:hypothetical protein